MKNSIYLLAALTFAALMFAACGTPEKTETTHWKPKTGSYTADSHAIDTLVMDYNWSDSLFYNIDNAIGVDFSYKKFDLDQAIGLYVKLLNQSADYSYRHVDSIMQLPTINNADVKQYREMNKFLYARYNEKRAVVAKNGSKVNTTHLDQSKELIDNYDKVKGWAETTFLRKANIYQRYSSPSAAEIENKIRKNKYWKTHFCHNNDFNQAISALAARRVNAKNKYYDNCVSDYITYFKNDTTNIFTKLEVANELMEWMSGTEDNAAKAYKRLDDFLVAKSDFINNAIFK